MSDPVVSCARHKKNPFAAFRFSFLPAQLLHPAAMLTSLAKYAFVARSTGAREKVDRIDTRAAILARVTVTLVDFCETEEIGKTPQG